MDWCHITLGMISPLGTFLYVMMSVGPYLLPVMRTNLFNVVPTIPVTSLSVVREFPFTRLTVVV